MQAESIEFDGLDETATATFATLFFKGLPILASPFELSDQRPAQVGFSNPELRLELDPRYDIRTPYYFNLAPTTTNIDAAPDEQTRRAV